jgi:hypothetical protein
VEIFSVAVCLFKYFGKNWLTQWTINESDLNNPARHAPQGCEAETVLFDLQEAGILMRESCKS